MSVGPLAVVALALGARRHGGFQFIGINIGEVESLQLLWNAVLQHADLVRLQIADKPLLLVPYHDVQKHFPCGAADYGEVRLLGSQRQTGQAGADER